MAMLLAQQILNSGRQALLKAQGPTEQGLLACWPGGAGLRQPWPAQQERATTESKSWSPL